MKRDRSGGKDTVTATASRGHHRTPAHTTAALIIGILGVLASLALPFAPVNAERTTVTWPQAGKPAQSTTAFFVPYQPEGVHLRIPCAAVRAGQDRGSATTLASSDLPGKPTKGFSVSTADNSLLVLVGGREVYRAPVGGGDCGVALDAGPHGSSLHVGSRAVSLPRDHVREVFAFATDLRPDQSAGLRVSAQTANWFQNSPSTAKLLLTGFALLAVLASLVLLVLGDRSRRRSAGTGVTTGSEGSTGRAAGAGTSRATATPTGAETTTGTAAGTETSNGTEPSEATAGPSAETATTTKSGGGTGKAVGTGTGSSAGTEPPAHRNRFTAARQHWPELLVDLGILVFLAVWAVLGPLSPDDAFTEGIVRNALVTGDFTNYYRWENSSEAPFTLVLHMLQPLVALHADPLLLRLPSAVAGLATWLLLSRAVLPLVLPEHGRRRGVRVLLAVALLVWWLPFDLGVRPEPFIALGTTAVLACVLRATSGAGGPRLTLLGLGALSGGLTVAVNPVGVTALAPVLLLAPRLWRTLQPRDGSRSRLVPWGWCALGACLASVALVAMFADQSLFGAQQATALHRFYGPDVGWFQEIRRYQYLLGFDDYQGGMARRLPVLLTTAVAVCATLLVVRGARRLPGMRLVPLPIGCLGIGIALLWLTPSKWTHYFGALAGFGGIALTAGVVLLVAAARQWAERREVLLVGGVGTLLTVVAACLAFSGTNTYFLYSHFGVPRDELPFRPLNNPLPWLLLVAVLLGATLHPRSGGRAATRRMLARMPALVAVVATGSMVVVLLVSFVLAPINQAGSYSVGGQMLAELSGRDCGIVDHVVTTENAPDGVLKPGGGSDELTAFTAGGGDSGDPPAEAGPNEWGSLGGGAISTGSLTSRWFSAPQVGRGQELAVSASGRTGDGNRLALEFARSTGSGPPQVLGQQVLDDAYKERDKRPIYPSDHQIRQEPQANPEWRTLHVAPEQVPPGANRVRVVAQDNTTDPDGWLAVTGPRLLDVRPLRQFLAGKRPAYVDWSMTWAAPCVRNVPLVGNGLAEAPTVLLNPPESLGFEGRASYNKEIGGSFAGVDEVGNRRTVPTRLRGTRDEPKYEDWGQVSTVTYPVARDAYDTRTTLEQRWGWQGEGFTTNLRTERINPG